MEYEAYITIAVIVVAFALFITEYFVVLCLTVFSKKLLPKHTSGEELSQAINLKNHLNGNKSHPRPYGNK